MAVDRNRLAAALAYEEERRRRMMESVPLINDRTPTTAPRQSLRTDLENLSSGLGQGIVNQLEGVKGLITDPVGAVKGTYEGVKGIVRDPSVLADALRYTAQKATSGPLGAGEVVGEMLGPMRGKPPMAEIDVYHGSPHRFEEFDASKIGTGEGAQAYGHGIYLAESPGVAKAYQQALSDSQYILKSSGKPLKDAKLSGAFAPMMNEMRRNGRSDEDIASTLEKLSQRYSDKYGKDAKKTAEKLRSGAISYKTGNLYTADLPDEMVDRMLDYDLPINQQNPYVLEALDRAGINTQSTAMAGPMAQGQEGHLAKFGIPGIKYMDEGSRGYVVDLFHKGKPYAQHEGVKHATLQSAQERIAEAQAAGFEPKLGTRGTRNFVVFPGEEKKVKILRRE